MFATVFAKPRGARAAEQFIQRLAAAEMAQLAGQPTAKGRKNPPIRTSREPQERRRRLEEHAASIRADEERQKRAPVYTTRFSSPDERQRAQDAKRRLRKVEDEIRADELRSRRNSCRNPYRTK